MSTTPDTPKQAESEVQVEPSTTARDAANWASPITKLEVGELPPDAVNINVAGRRVTSPIQGFGKLWQKTYACRLLGAGATPQEVIATWKEHFPEFWPKGNRFYGPITGIAPGEVAVLNLGMPGGLKLSTGVFVLYADEESFTFMTPEGHMFASWITFSAHEQDGVTVAKVDVLLRAGDPMYEFGMALGGHRKEDAFWEHTLKALGNHFGATPEFSKQAVCIDKKRQWRYAKNIWKNSAMRSGFYMMGAPFRAAAKPFRGKGNKPSDPS
jgi:hypothetical protein